VNTLGTPLFLSPKTHLSPSEEGEGEGGGAEKMILDVKF